MSDSTSIAAILALTTGAVGLFLGLPIFLDRIKERRRQKRQNAVRDVIKRRGVATKADIMRDGVRDADAAKAIHELHESGEIVSSVAGEEALWKFKTHEHQTETRLTDLPRGRLTLP
jgi:hypothetical protein